MPDNDRIILSLRPSSAFILIWSPGMLMLSLAVIAAGLVINSYAGFSGTPLVRGGIAALILTLAWAALVRSTSSWVLTESRITASVGVIRRVARDVPLRNVQHLVLAQTALERFTGTGSIAVASAGTDSYALAWITVNQPAQVLATIREAVEKAGGSPQRPGRTRPIVIGLTGGIGAGKSAVARVLASMGAMVLDSDKDAKAALDRPEVRAELIRWWGDRILGADGRVDRKAVASIIFSDPVQRQRLERLVHPLVKLTRDEMIERAKRDGVEIVVVDAPLLLEAGLDAECDAVIFVDAPREQRLARVKASRGWDEEEMNRREIAQIPLDEKRRRADYEVSNDTSEEALRDRVAGVLAGVRAAPDK